MKTSCCQSTRHFEADPDTLICRNPDCAHFLRPTIPYYGPKTWNYLFMAFFFAFFFIFPFNDFSSVNGFNNEDTKILQRNFSLPLTSDNLKEEIQQHKILCPDQVYAQIMLESGNLNSFLVKKTNNLLGMRYPFKRSTKAIGIFLPDENRIIYGDQQSLLKYNQQNHYAVYSNWQECVADYKCWQDENFKLTDRYLHFLATVYAEDQHYEAKIRSYSKSTSSNK